LVEQTTTSQQEGFGNCQTDGWRTGCPVDVDQWEWRRGFYPGIEPGGHQYGTAVDFQSRAADFEAAWRMILPTLTDADFNKWRHQRASRHGNMRCGMRT
jgi:hypothetical protein